MNVIKASLKAYFNAFKANDLIRIALCLSLVAECLMSKRLWIGQDRSFPTVPLLYNITPNTDIVSFVFAIALLLLLILAYRRSMPLLVVLVLIFAFLIVMDVERIQPWLYQMIFLMWAAMTLSPERAKARVLLMLALIYIMSGIQKINPFFFKEVMPSLGEMSGLGLNNYTYLLNFFGYIIPGYEILAGLCLLHPKSRKIALPAIIVMHTAIIAIMGENSIVIPWNICLAIIALILFIWPYQANIFALFGSRKSAPGLYFIVLAFGILPTLGMFGYWPICLSTDLYTGLKPECVYYTSDAQLNKILPEWYKDIEVHNEAQGIYLLDMDAWAIKELNVPTIGSESQLEAIAKKVCHKASANPDDGVYFTTKSRWHYGPVTRKCNCDSLLRLQKL